jgi:hypothetical protein
MGDWCHTSTSRDLKTITARVEHEGISFLTITLPNFGKDFEKSLDQGFVAHDQFAGFQRSGGLPRFLGGFLELVFTRETGVLLDNPNIDAIHSLRQITLMFAKVALECSSERTKAAIDNYFQCEQEVKESDKRQDDGFFRDFDRLVTLLWSDVFSKVDSDIYHGRIIPKHGPGATADKLKGNQKYNQIEWTERLEQWFPAGEFLTPSWSHFLEVADRVNYLEPGAERPVRVITVPKTLKTPRIIAVEPAAMQYVQQGILESFTEAVRADDTVRHFVDNQSQEPNRHLAEEGSRSGTLATLDLSEASDRVSNQHVRRLLRNFPNFAGGVDACRSRKADVPGHGVIRLAKFASMGSALCFPMEAVVFATVVFIGIEKSLGHQLTKKDIKSYIGQVRVYGDDIIVPVDHVSSVVDALHLFGFKVNLNKSFWTGRFRESCGKEYFGGEDVSIVRVRQLLPSQRRHTQEIISTVELRNHLYKMGLWKTASYLDNILEAVIPLPYVGEFSPALGRHSFLGYQTDKICPNLQIPLVRAMTVKVTLPASPLEGYGALMKGFLKRGDLPIADRDHLMYAGRPVSVDIKHRMVPAY